MEMIAFYIYFSLMPTNISQEQIVFSENIDYCTNIMHNPNMVKEFYNSCNSDEVNTYIMMVKNHFN